MTKHFLFFRFYLCALFSVVFVCSPDVFGGVDDLFNSRDPQCDVHGGDTSEVKGFEGHLSSRLTDALSTQRPDR